MALYGDMPDGWRILNVSLGGEPSWAWAVLPTVGREGERGARRGHAVPCRGGAGRYVGGAMPTVDGVDLPPGWDVLRFGSRVGCMSDWFAAEPVVGGYVLIPALGG